MTPEQKHEFMGLVTTIRRLITEAEGRGEAKVWVELPELLQLLSGVCALADHVQRGKK